MILKVLLVVAVIAIVYFMFFKKKPLESTKDDKKSSLKDNDMVECANCGIYSELSESILSNAKYYCSSECASKAS